MKTNSYQRKLRIQAWKVIPYELHGQLKLYG